MLFLLRLHFCLRSNIQYCYIHRLELGLGHSCKETHTRGKIGSVDIEGGGRCWSKRLTLDTHVKMSLTWGYVHFYLVQPAASLHFSI